ncbi:Predicted ATPase [Roseomonas gilardii subsp. rosea]|nr:Predicted ATPase [Roseomonas gilardii subsp. rosea]
MPLDNVPDYKGLPSGSFLPWRSNKNFIGRRSDLLDVAAFMIRQGPAKGGGILAITGVGGLGKTQFAVEFAYRFGHWFSGGVFWVNCENERLIADSIIAAGSKIPFPAGFSSLPKAEKLSLIASNWANELPKLIIFDGCENPEILEDWLPRGGGCRVLLTSLRDSWPSSHAVDVHALARFSSKESIELIFQHRPDFGLQSGRLSRLAEELEGLPLAVELAGQYLLRYKNSSLSDIDSYLKSLKQKNFLNHRSLDGTLSTAPGGYRLPTGHTSSVFKTFFLSFEKIGDIIPAEKLARKIFFRLAWLMPNEDVFQPLLKLMAEFMDSAEDSSHDFFDALEILLRLGLLERGVEWEDGFRIHRLLAEFAKMVDDDRARTRIAVENSILAIASRMIVLNDPMMFMGWHKHFLHVAAESWSDMTGNANELIMLNAMYNVIIGKFAPALDLMEKTAESEKSTNGENSKQYAKFLVNLGICQRERGDYFQAERTLKLALEKKEQIFGRDDAEVSIALSNLANVQRQLKKVPLAIANATRAVKIKEKEFGPESIDFANTLLNLASAQAAAGTDYLLQIALGNYLKSYNIHSKQEMPSYAQLAKILVNIGVVQGALGNVVDARINIERGLATKQKIFGEENPNLIMVLVALGDIERKCENIEKAIACFERALKICQDSCTADDERTVQAKIGLDQCLKQRRTNNDL